MEQQKKTSKNAFPRCTAGEGFEFVTMKENSNPVVKDSGF